MKNLIILSTLFLSFSSFAFESMTCSDIEIRKMHSEEIVQSPFNQNTITLKINSEDTGYQVLILGNRNKVINTYTNCAKSSNDNEQRIFCYPEGASREDMGEFKDFPLDSKPVYNILSIYMSTDSKRQALIGFVKSQMFSWASCSTN